MEQNILDPAKFKISLMNLDSRFSNQNSNGKGEFRIVNPRNIRNVIRIRMASSEIPLVVYPFSLRSGNLNFSVKLGAAPTFTEILIPEGSYSGTTFAAAIQTALQTVNVNFTCTFNSTNSRILIKHSTTTFQLKLASTINEIQRRPTNWGIGYNMGFREQFITSVSDGAGAFIAVPSTVITLNPAPYYLLQLECPNPVDNVTSPIGKETFITAFAKVILKGQQYVFQFDDNSNLLRKEYTFLAPHDIPQFTVRLVDQWGMTVDMGSNDWSVTIEITEVMNSKTHAVLSNTYNKK